MTTASVDVARVVITGEKLRHKIETGRDVVILEVRRNASSDPTGNGIPGAHAVALETDLVGERSEGSGNLPLPSPQQVQDAVRRWGINADSIVVVYSPEQPALAARTWWTLKWAGVPNVRVLEGGLSEWEAAGGQPGSPADVSEAGTFVVQTGSLPVLDADESAALARAGVLLDARAVSGYVGEPSGGHIPGARSLPGPSVLGDAGALKDDDELRALFGTAGVDADQPVGAYCGGGTSATLTVLALAKLGITASLYPGSFSAYSSDPTRPVAVGGWRG